MLNTLIHWSREHHMVICDKIHLWSPVVTVGPCWRWMWGRSKELNTHVGKPRCCSDCAGSQVPSLQRGRGFRARSKAVSLCSAAMCWLCGEWLELCWSPVGTRSPCNPAAAGSTQCTRAGCPSALLWNNQCNSG